MQTIAAIDTNILCDRIDLACLFGGEESSRFTDFINNKSDDLHDILNSLVTPGCW